MSDTSERKYEQHFLTLFYGNEDKSEGTDLLWFKSKEAAATYLRALADKIESFESSKKYRSSERWIFQELEELEPK
jgi:hypothetical protein